MKPRNLWLLALGMMVLTLLVAGRYAMTPKDIWRMGVQSAAVVLAAPRAPAVHWGKLENFGDLSLKLNVKSFIALGSSPVGERARFNGFSYIHLQAGLYLVELGKQRIFIITDPFVSEGLDTSLPIDFKNDWTLLQRSSLLPKAWPVPQHGWVVLNAGTLSKKLKALSTEHQKPIVRPTTAGTVWLEKEAETQWQVLLPR